jgi:hypothetical protein
MQTKPTTQAADIHLHDEIALGFGYAFKHVKPQRKR